MVNTKLLQYWFDEVWNKANENVIDELLHRNAVIHGLQTDAAKSGAEAFRPFYQSFKKEFPTVNVKLEPIFSYNGFEAAQCHVSLKSADGKDAAFSGVTIAKFEDGKLVEGWNGFDFLTMYQQLGFKLV
jgi:predicted ester cyclase